MNKQKIKEELEKGFLLLSNVFCEECDKNIENNLRYNELNIFNKKLYFLKIIEHNFIYHSIISSFSNEKNSNY